MDPGQNNNVDANANAKGALDECIVMPGGVNMTLKSIRYQIRLLILLVLRSANSAFKAATEISDAGKFDDVVIHIPGKGTTFLQSKYKKQVVYISYDTLMHSNDYKLLKYYESFIGIKKKFTDMSDLILCTNIKFNIKPGEKLVTLAKGKEKESITLEMQDGKDALFGYAERFKLAKDPMTRTTLERYLKNSTPDDLNQFIEKFVFISNYQYENLDSDINDSLRDICPIDSDVDEFREQFEERLTKWVEDIGKEDKKNFFDEDQLKKILNVIEALPTSLKFEGAMSCLFKTEHVIKFRDPLSFLEKGKYFAIGTSSHDYPYALEEITERLNKLYDSKESTTKVPEIRLLKSSMPSKDLEKQLVSFCENKENSNTICLYEKEGHSDILDKSNPKIFDALGKYPEKIFITINKREELGINPNIKNVSLKQSYMRRFLTDDKFPTNILCIRTKSEETRFVASEAYEILDRSSRLILQTANMEFLNGLNAFLDNTKIRVCVIEVDTSSPEQIKQYFDQITPKLIASKRKVLIISQVDVPVNHPDIVHIQRAHVTLSEMEEKVLNKKLEKKIQFQAKPVTLMDIIDKENKNLLGKIPVRSIEKIDTVAEKIPTSENYNEHYYIKRSFRHETILLDSVKQKNQAFELAYSEQEFISKKSANPSKDIHRVTNEGDQIKWVKTDGSIGSLLPYVDLDKGNLIFEDDLLDAKSTPKYLVLVNDAGMGKTTVLSKFAVDLKEGHPSDWILNITLNYHTSDFQEMSSKNLLMNDDFVIEFLQSKVLELKPEAELERNLFKTSCLETGNVQVILDGADEVAPDYEKCVFQMLQALKKLKLKRLIISTRPELGKSLEKAMQQCRYSLLQFKPEDQIDFCIKYWKTESELKDVIELEKIAKVAIEVTNKVIDSELVSFSGIPLTTKMVAEVLNVDIPKYVDGNTMEISTKFTNLYGLYEYFAKQKFDIYIEDKIKVDNTKVNVDQVKKNLEGELVLLHQRFALRAVLDESVFRFLPEELKKVIIKEEEITLLKVGIVTSAGGKLRMIHKTFGEFYMSRFALDEVVKEPEHKKDSDMTQHYRNILQLVVQVLLVEDRLKVIRTFMNCRIKELDSANYWPRFSHRFRNDFWLFKNYENAIYVSVKEQNQDTYEFCFRALHTYPSPKSKDEKKLTKKILLHATSPVSDYIAYMPYRYDILTHLVEKLEDAKFLKILFSQKYSINIENNLSKRKLLIASLNKDENCLKLLKYIHEKHSDNTDFVKDVLLNSTMKKNTFLHVLVEEGKTEASLDQLHPILEVLEKIGAKNPQNKKIIEQLISKPNRDKKTLLEMLETKKSSGKLSAEKLESIKKLMTANVLSNGYSQDIELKTIK